MIATFHRVTCDGKAGCKALVEGHGRLDEVVQLAITSGWGLRCRVVGTYEHLCMSCWPEEQVRDQVVASIGGPALARFGRLECYTHDEMAWLFSALAWTPEYASVLFPEGDTGGMRRRYHEARL
jgi:hypothetical protein